MSTRYLISFLEGLPAQGSSRSHGVTINGHSPRYAASDQRAKLDELKLLLTEAKEGLDVKNTTSEFFDTLERITNELRGMTEHSTAFLARVRKSDAPDYFNIVKHPMDLGTVLKKVKAQQYKDKKAFKADLDLIWDNCLLYNTLATHPLRKSATILRNRANHLLEFVTDPAAAPPPTLHRPSTTRTNRLLSRLDALDASHVISSTAGQISRSSRHMSEDVQSAVSGMPDAGDDSYMADQTDAAYPESAPESEAEDDFQDIEEDEEDESIRTRKGLVSLKSQPGGGRNLDLLRGLAANQPQLGESTDTSLSLSPSGIDKDAGLRNKEERARSASPGSVRLGTPSPAPPSQSIPDVPGTVPGQGAALLARRATAAATSARRVKPRNASLPPVTPSIPFHEKPALMRTSDSMAKLANLSDSLAGGADNAVQAYRLATASNAEEIEAGPSLLPLLPHSLTGAPETGSSPGPASASPLVRARSKQAQSATLEAADLLWWQAATSESFARSGLPEVPYPNAAASTSGTPQSEATHKGVGKPAAVVMKADLANLRKVKSLHRRMARLKGKSREMPEESDLSASDEEVNTTSDEEARQDYATGRISASNSASTTHRRKKRRRKQRLDLLDPPSDLQDRQFSPHANQQVLSTFCSIMLQQTGFDNVQRLALDSLTSLLSTYLTNLGRIFAFHKDRFAERLPFGAMLRRSLSQASPLTATSAGPIQSLSEYLVRDLPERSEKTSSLAARLEAAYVQEMTAAEEGKSKYAFDEAELEDFDTNDAVLAKLVRVLLDTEHDHLALLSLGIDKDSYHFEAAFLYAQAFRQIFPASSLTDQPPFMPPPAHIPLHANDQSSISAQIGLLRPFLEARKETEHALYDDDDLPETETTVAQQARRTIAAKPDVPPATGRVMLGKRKKEAAVTAAAASAAPVVNPAGLGITAQINAALKAAGNVAPAPVQKKAKTAIPIQQGGQGGAV